MKLTDMIALARAGYKKADIDNMIKLDEEKDKAEEEAKKQAEEELAKLKEKQKDHELSTDNEEVVNEAQKKALEKANKEIETLKEQLKKAQEANINRDNSGNEESFEEKLNDTLSALIH